MKFGNDVRIKTVTSWFPPDRETAEDAVTAGKLTATEADRLGNSELVVSARWSAPEMAAAAGRDAIVGAGWSPSDVGLVIHTWIYHQGHDIWSPPHFVANAVGVPHAVNYGVQQGCNAGAFAMRLAALHLAAEPQLGAALITTGDRFAEPGFDRWKSDYDVAFGDAGTAALLHLGGPGTDDDYALLSMATATDSEFELMLRHGNDFSPAPMMNDSPIDIRRLKKSYAREHGSEKFDVVAKQLLRTAIADSLRDAGLSPEDPRIKYVVLPRFGARLLDGQIQIVNDMLKAEPVHFGATTGHLGCGSFLANLVDLRDRMVLQPGDIALVLNSGAAWTFCCAVVQVPVRE